MQQPLTFRLDQDPKGRGLRCDSDGLFLGGEALLRRDEAGIFETRQSAELLRTFIRIYGEETDWESRLRSVKLVANALNKKDMARAMMTAVLMRLPEPRSQILISDVDGVLARADFNPDEPRDERGQWTRDGDGGVESGDVNGNPGVQLADTGRSDIAGDPVAEAAARAATSSHHAPAASNSHDRSVGGAPKGFWETLGSNLSNDVEFALSEIGRAEAIQSNADRAVGDAELNVVAEGADAVNQFLERPVGGSMPITPDFPIWGGYGMDMTLAPTRPITVGDFVAPAVNLVSVLPIGEGGSAAAELSELAATESKSFIVLPVELPENFNIAWPVGRYEIPADTVPGTTRYGDLVGEQIGKLFQDRLPLVDMILRGKPGMRGIDIELPVTDVPKLGARYLEIKPLSESGYYRFRSQIARWKLSEPVLAVTYDDHGNIYYGFPK